MAGKHAAEDPAAGHILEQLTDNSDITRVECRTCHWKHSFGTTYESDGDYVYPYYPNLDETMAAAAEHDETVRKQHANQAR